MGMTDAITDRVVLDPALTYIASALNTSTSQAVKAVCKEFYCLEEILRAKDVLWEAADNAIIGKMKNRRDSSRGDQMEKSVEDLISSITKLISVDSLPKFAVGPNELARIPKIAPHETLSINMCQRLRQLEEEMGMVMVALSASSALGSRHHPLSSAKKPGGQGDVSGPLNLLQHQKLAETPQATTMDTPSTTSSQKDPKQMTMAAVASHLTDGDFTLVKRPKRKNKRASRVKGKAENSEILRGGTTTFKLALTNVNAQVNADDIKKYVSQKAPTVTVHTVEDKSSDAWETKRYVITFDRSDFDQVNTADFWPANVYLREWRNAIPRKQGTQSSAQGSSSHH